MMLSLLLDVLAFVMEFQAQLDDAVMRRLLLDVLVSAHLIVC